MQGIKGSRKFFLSLEFNKSKISIPEKDEIIIETENSIKSSISPQVKLK